MDPKSQILRYLQSLKKNTTLLSELEALFLGQPCTYEEFSGAVLELEAAGIMQMVQSKGRTGKQPSIAYQYKVQKSRLKEDLHKEIHRARIFIHPLIGLDAYYSLESGDWELDWPYIERIDAYLKSHTLPKTPVPAPERSFELVGDEKWITDKHGKELLIRTGLWDKLHIIPVADPLMMAVNPGYIANTIHRHLIVENKTTYQALLQALPDVPFTTLIFGGGYRITKSIELLPLQLPLSASIHQFYYFGDIDHEGIAIWHMLNERVLEWFGSPAKPALPFYRACLDRSFVYGKENQRNNDQAVQAFMRHFSQEEQARISAPLAAGGYYPQEILHTQELCALWRNTQWIT
ncbi:Wadjet anti-phage system protein JetD domain-containing protein [Paenibacillus sp. GCM10027628]|uniref:Wadjet anti-phage system protein JetD domain-containing protein n=1 Tax=Paenibacillus sp. GCM10027628 TaxID=3273413 RepID=UPI003627FAC3